MTLSKTLVGIIGSGLIGYDPFDRQTWSNISYFVFSQLKERGALHRAFGVEVPQPLKYLLMARHWNPNREKWRQHYYMSRTYREALTTAVNKNLHAGNFSHDFFILGAMYDVPRLVQGRAKCFSYHDGNLATSLKSPYALRGLSKRRIDEGLDFERNVYQGIDRIFAMSEYLRRSFIEDCGVPANRISNIGAGINLDTVPEPNAGKQYDTKEILFIGVNFQRKGGSQLLKAFQFVREVEPDATLHIVGPRQLQIAQELRRGVQYHGFLNKFNPADADRLQKLFTTCSLFVMPSLFEPFGIAPLEAMAHAIPAVVSRGWALEEIVTPGVTGAHVTPGSIEDLVVKLRTLLAAPDNLQRMGQAARAFVLSRYTWPQVMARMIEEIREAQQQ